MGGGGSLTMPSVLRGDGSGKFSNSQFRLLHRKGHDMLCASRAITRRDAMACLPKGYDFRLLAEAQRRGGHYFYITEFMTAVNAFLHKPSYEAATHLQKAAPVLEPLFKACSPGGHLYEFKKILCD
jgi:hypothetical protein